MKALTISYVLAEKIIKSWWIIFFISVCSFIYDKASYKQAAEIQKLQQKVSYFIYEIQKNYETQKQLKSYITQQQNPELIELVLIKKLGLVPEGYTKICLPDSLPDS